MTSKTERVRLLFESPEKYLDPRQYDIRIRVETVQQFTDALSIESVLDIGCGDGSISLPLLPRCKRLTLLDLSTNMLDLACKRIPPSRLDDVERICLDFMNASFEPQSFDLIFCIGVLAHVDSPSAVIEKVARLAKPGAWIILEFTDSFHFWGVPVVLYQKALTLLRPEPYKLNRLKRQQVLGLCRDNGLGVSGVYRYGLPPLGSHKLFSQKGMYSLTRHLFGTSDRNRRSWMGNQFLYRLQKL
ncbi:MAG: class I SAM-dependent methyltransferase [Acidobacteriaceae bacterium]|jgi:2-polyprenyl-3-methyl-5-hydroxy-6-metoxy-1,4-benzoquinol methylase